MNFKTFLSTLWSILIAAIFIFSQILYAQTANHLVISEVLVNGKYESNAADNDEFVEIYNPTSAPVDVSNWTLDYRSASGTSFNTKYTFPSGAMIQSHKFYLIGGGGVTDRDNSSDSQILGLGNSGGGVFLRNSSGSTIDLVGWGSASSSNYEGTVVAVPSEGISLERKANSSSNASTMGIGGADEFEGNGYDSDNNSSDFVQRTTPQPQNSLSPAEPAVDNGGNGTGTVYVTPKILNASEATSLSFTFRGDGTHTLDSVLIVIPSSTGWTWSQNLSNVFPSAPLGPPNITIQNDTIYIGSANITSSDSLNILITNVNAPDDGGYTDFLIKTAVSDGTPLPVSPLPRITILKVVPIVDIHVNDAAGVPTSPYGVGSSVTISGIITADFNQHEQIFMFKIPLRGLIYIVQ